MSLHLEFEPHSWYKHFAIRKWDGEGFLPYFNASSYKWEAYTDDGNTYRTVMLEADTLEELKEKITDWHEKRNNRDQENRRMIGEK